MSARQKAPSLTRRAILAVLLLVGFYLLAFAIVGLLIFMLYAMVVYANRINLRIVLFALIGAGTVLWSLIPRRDVFVPPGPLLDPAEQPKFFKEVQDIAAATNQSMPVEIYIDPQVNAWVANRGGVMGFGSRRIMGVGLPILQSLTVSQFRAVLAHEFGHYHGGDTKLGPWIFKTRQIIGRTITNLAQSAGNLHLPFLWYGQMFLKVTHAISREQEYAADALASNVVGARHLIDGLKTIHGSAVAYDAFWQRSYSPVLNAGYRAPLLEGFSQYMQDPEISTFMNTATEEAMKVSNHDPYDTHPPLPMRIEAVADLPMGTLIENEPLAITLLQNVPDVEHQIFSNIAKMNSMQGFKPLGWDETGPIIYIPLWKNFFNGREMLLKDVSPKEFPQLAENIKQFAEKFVAPTQEAKEGQAESTLSVGLALALHEAGWELETQLHKAAFFKKDRVEIYPFSIIADLRNNTISADEWLQTCESTGIADIDLAAVGKNKS